MNERSDLGADGMALKTLVDAAIAAAAIPSAASATAAIPEPPASEPAIPESVIPAVVPDPVMADAAIVERVLTGDSALFELLMRRYNRLLFRLARGIVRDDDEARDVVQAAYVRAYYHLEQRRAVPDAARRRRSLRRVSGLKLERRREARPRRVPEVVVTAAVGPCARVAVAPRAGCAPARPETPSRRSGRRALFLPRS
jgi:hypothetical protein